MIDFERTLLMASESVLVPVPSMKVYVGWLKLANTTVWRENQFFSFPESKRIAQTIHKIFKRLNLKVSALTLKCKFNNTI